MHDSKGEPDEARYALEQSQTLYAEGFSKIPTDTYTGINAASKAAMLGDMEQAKELAGQVLERLKEQAQDRGGEPSSDYWERATEPEALLLLGDGEQACKLYHEDRVAHQGEKGNIDSTAKQVRRLLAVLPVEEAVRAKLMQEVRIGG